MVGALWAACMLCRQTRDEETMTNARKPLDDVTDRLVDAYTRTYRFLAVCARDGDFSAMLVLDAIEGGRVIPSSAIARDWLAGVARERRMLRPTESARQARALLEEIDVAEALARPFPGSAEGVWAWMVRTAREGMATFRGTGSTRRVVQSPWDLLG